MALHYSTFDSVLYRLGCMIEAAQPGPTRDHLTDARNSVIAASRSRRDELPPRHQAILAALAEHGGSPTKAARTLGLSVGYVAKTKADIARRERFKAAAA